MPEYLLHIHKVSLEKKFMPSKQQRVVDDPQYSDEYKILVFHVLFVKNST